MQSSEGVLRSPPPPSHTHTYTRHAVQSRYVHSVVNRLYICGLCGYGLNVYVYMLCMCASMLYVQTSVCVCVCVHALASLFVSTVNASVAL